MKLDWVQKALGVLFVGVLIAGSVGITAEVKDRDDLVAQKQSQVVLVQPADYIPIPNKLDVNGVEWRVVLVNDMGPFVGFTDCATKVIRLTEKPGATRRQERLIHELSHAAVCGDSASGFHSDNMYYNSSSNEDHEGIYKFSAVWAELLLRNPTLGPYLSQPEE